MSVHLLNALCQWSPEEGIGFPGSGVQDDCDLPCGCWESNMCSLKEQLVIFTTKQSLQPL